MAELLRCPECGAAAILAHIVDTYDRADYGWQCGCGKYKNDGRHTRAMYASADTSIEAIEKWNRMVMEYGN